MSNIPKLRFPEFSGEWEDKILGKIATFYSGGTPTSSKSEYYKGDIPFIKSGEISKEKTEQFINREALEQSSAKMVNKGDLLYALYGATSGEVALSKIEGAINQAVLCIRTNQSKYYLKLWLNNKKEKIISTYLQGGQGNLSAQIMKSLKIPFPSLPEQQKIASFLESVDSWISNLKSQKETLDEYKKGIMQKIFAQEIRFKDENGNDFPDWEEEKLGDISTITTGKLDANAMKENGQYRFYTCAKNYFQIDKYAFDTEALLISGNGANVGYIHYYKGKFNAYQRTYVLDNFTSNIIYIKYFLETFLSFRIDKQKNEGNTPYIVLSALKDMIIKLPSLSEQQKIASFLCSLDDQIQLKTQQIEKAEEWKKGLMQKMFV